MKAYDSNKPLIHIHLPKTGGTTVREIYQEWFGEGLLLHYFDEIRQKAPQKYNLEALHTSKNAVCVYGHFNSKRNFGIKHYYPEVNQFVTILRDPFEKAVSTYFFLRNNAAYWKNSKIVIPKVELREHLLSIKGETGVFSHFPQEITIENYKEVLETNFIEIGILEYLDESIARIAKKLNKEFEPSTLKVLNDTNRCQRIPYEIKDKFIDANPLVYAVYDYALSKYTS